MRFVKLALLLIGFYVLYLTVQSVGLDTVTKNIFQLQWRVLPLLPIYPLIFAFNTLGWVYSFPSNLPKHVPFRELYVIRIIGETLNSVIPWAASMGGEPVKVQLLKSRHQIPLAEGLASILIVHTTFWVSVNLFVIGGLLVSHNTMPLTPILWKSVLAFLLILGAGGVFLLAGLRFGIFEKIHALGEKFKWWGPDSKSKLNRFIEIDHDIKKFYKGNSKRFFYSVFFNFLAWFTGTLEVFWIAHILGMDISFGEAWLLEVLIQVLRIVTFFIPSSIGTQEGGIVLIFLQLGFDKTIGLTFAVIRRLREIFWMGVGLLLWSFMTDRPQISKAD